MLKISKVIGNSYYTKINGKRTGLAIVTKCFSSSSTIGLNNLKPRKSGTINEVYIKLMKRLGLKTGYIKEAENRDHLLKYTPIREELPPRTMSDSYMEAFIPLRNCEETQVKYVNNVGYLRLGRVMEALDLFAAWICAQHVLLPKLPTDVPLPYTFLTILVDKMTFSKMPSAYNKDIRLSGFVSWVGTSSLEINAWIEQEHQNTFRLITHAVFVMAARSATNAKAAPINPLNPSNDQEKLIYKLGEKRRKTRQYLQKTSIFKIKPSEEEHTIMYSLFQNTTDNTHLQLNNRILPRNARWMNDAFIVNIFLSFPENRNAQNTLFGGFQMRQSFEISWMCAYLHCGSPPICEFSSDMSFDKPIQINSVVKMTAYIVYTEDAYMQIMTVAEILDPIGKVPLTTNVFYYTFSCKNKVTVVLPKTYHETMWYIHGRRKFYYSMEK